MGRVAILVLPLLLAAAPASQPTRIAFTESHPASDLKEWVRRQGGSVAMYKEAGAAYAIKDESFEVHVPAGCGPENPHGLFVWISPSPRTRIPEAWIPILERHKLIWVSPNNAGNNRNAVTRISLAMDAVHNLSKQYAVDPRRVYVSGMSGGGRASSIAIVGFPDVFTAGIPMMGCNFYRQLPAPPAANGAEQFYPRGSFRPPAELFRLAHTRPIVLITGDTDMNRDSTKAAFGGFKQDVFKHVTYLEAPNTGHTLPPAEYVEKALSIVDEVIVRQPVAATQPAAPDPRLPGVRLRPSGAARESGGRSSPR